MFNNIFPENHAFYEIMCKNIVDKIKMRIVCSITFFPKIMPFMR